MFFDFGIHPLDLQSDLNELRPILSARIKIQLDTVVPIVGRAKQCSLLSDLSAKKSRKITKLLSHQSCGFYSAATKETMSVLLLSATFDE